jgi:peptidyl-dipeptidase Dcp
MAFFVDEVAVETGVVLTPRNPFARPSDLPFGVPPFDRIKDADYEPAFLAGMAQQRSEVRAIAANPESPTFANTLEALERTGSLLDRVGAAFGAIAGANTNPEIEAIQQRMAPLFAAHSDAIYLDAALFERVRVIYEERASLGLAPEQMRLTEDYYQHFVRAGALLNEVAKAAMTALNKEESTLSNAFSQKLLAATKAAAFATNDRAALAGLSDQQLDAAATAAAARGIEGYLLPLQNTTQQPPLRQLTNRATREALFQQAWNRTERGDENDTRQTVARLAQVRAAKAVLLGFDTYAAWKLKDQMAKTPATAIGFLDGLVPAATAAAKAEQKAIEAVIAAQGGDFALKPWDWDFYAEQVRKAEFDLDEDALRPYFEVRTVLTQGVFFAATQLFGITFKPRHDMPVYHPDVEVFEIFNADGSHLAIFYCDWFKRDNKRGGAWMSSFVRQSRLLAAEPVIYNVANFTKPAPGEPALISFSDVTTMFHEFGHALHGMFSEVEYPSLSGTSVPRDFVEFPSQFNERWALYPEVFERYARHFDDGSPMPAELAAKLKRAQRFHEGYAKIELLAAAQLDVQWHMRRADAPLADLNAFEEAALEAKRLRIDAIPPRYRSSYFAHIWGGGYAAGYYAYLWSQMLDDAGWEWFEQHGGLTRANGDRLRRMILSRGNTEDLALLFARWVGREADASAAPSADSLQD